DPRVDAFLSSAAVDYRLLPEDLEGSIAHARMLGRRGILPPASAEALATELEALRAEATSGSLTLDPRAEDVHSFVEAELTRRLGDAGRALHAGRSRNDQVAVDLRLFLKRAFARAGRGVRVAITALLDLAEGHVGTLMPGYTHLQRAQPVTFAFHLLAWCAALERDAGRFSDGLARADECPLGSCALAGSGLPLDREGTAEALGFSRPSRNALDATADRDACVEYTAAASTLLMHLSRFCEEVVLWSSEEFSYVRVGPACSTGSSVMPQKRNPDTAELIRGKTGRVFGSLINLLVLQKGLPLGYGRDLQEDKEAVFDAVDTVDACLEAFAVLVRSLEPDPARMRAAAGTGFLEATDIAELLVLRGVPFRSAYGAAKQIVLACLERRVRPADLSDADLAGISQVFARAGIRSGELAAYLDLEACVARRAGTGMPAPVRVREEIARLREYCSPPDR
ncbi:MAG TPA: argininosuccinate lyase, partial [Magnetospirillaceae bacterium]|nr:argininosuccinate lyase [Magnetospirillaceae bacterium]